MFDYTPLSALKYCSMCLVGFVGVTANAAVTTIGTDFFNARDWRTASVVKALDADMDNIYGTDGYGLFATQPAANNGSFTQAFPAGNAIINDGVTGALENIVSYPTGITANNGWFNLNQSISGFYGTIDNPEGGPDVAMGIARRNPFNGNALGDAGRVLQLVLGAGVEGADDPLSVLRLGVILNNDTNAGKAKAVRVIHTSGKGDSGFVANFAGNFTTSVMFWDISDYAVGDTIELWIDPQDDSNILGLSGLTFDYYSVPEPASLTLAALGLACIGRRRR